MADRMYRKVKRVDDGLWSGIKKLFGGGKKKSQNIDSEYEEGDRIKFQRTNGKNATGIIQNVYWNDAEGDVDYGVQSSITLDDIVVPEENIIDSRIKDNTDDYARRERKRGYRELRYKDIVEIANEYLDNGYGHIDKYFKSEGLENVESGFLNEREETDFFEIWAFEGAGFTLDNPEGIIVYFDERGIESYCEVVVF